MDSRDDAGTTIKTKSREQELKASLTYGVMENIDVILGLPYQWKKMEDKRCHDI